MSAVLPSSAALGLLRLSDLESEMKDMAATARGRATRFVIIGAGISGILMGIKLREQGYRNFIILEKGDALGGTWRDNTYPGVACDVAAHLYTYSFAPNPWW